MSVIRRLIGAKHTLNTWYINRINDAGTAQLALTFGCHFGQDMALVRVFELEASSRLFEALGCATVYFSFGCHVYTPHFWVNIDAKPFIIKRITSLK
jgi:hypothetical protein